MLFGIDVLRSFLVFKLLGDDVFRATVGLLRSVPSSGYGTVLEAANEAGRGRFPMPDRGVTALPRKARLTLGWTQKKVGSFKVLVIE